MKAVSLSTQQEHVQKLFGTHMSDSLAVKAQSTSQHIARSVHLVSGAESEK